MSSILVVSDFDGTLTETDTTYLSFKSTRRYLNACDQEKKQLLKQWGDMSVSYISGYVNVLEKCLNDCKQKDDFSLRSLDNVLQTLDSYSVNNRRWLAEQKHFENIVYGNLDDLIKEINFYPFATETLIKLQNEMSIDCKILSVNWFPELLQTSLNGIVCKEDIVTSNIPFVDESGNIDLGKVSTSIGKREWIQKWQTQTQKTTVYLGDSLTDILALLEANYGIIFGSNEKIHEIAETFGITVLPLSVLCGEKNGLVGGKNCAQKYLYSTQSWEEVHKFIKTL